MDERQSRHRPVSRRSVLAGAAAAGGAPALLSARPASAQKGDDAAGLFAELDRKIRQGMQTFAIPGAAVGVIYRGQEYVRGYGVTDVGDPKPVDGDTVFRIASTSKTFTGTTAMCLVDTGRLVLDRSVQSYVADFDAPPAAQDVTVRQVLNHSAGWLGYDYHDTGSDAGALARYANDVRHLPQLTPVGRTFSYNNAAISVAGRVIEAVTGGSFESAVQELVLEPLGLSRSRFSEHATGIDNLAMPHDVSDGQAVMDPSLFYLPRSCNPFGGVLSSVKDQLAYARFHLGDGRAADGRRIMRGSALRAMWSEPGPGGTLFVELDGMGVSWAIRPTAEGTKVVQHGGDLPGYHSGFMIVPDKEFGMTLLTNSESGPKLLAEIFVEDWALRRFAGLSNLPAEPRTLSTAELAPYEGTYIAQQIGFTGPPVSMQIRLERKDGALAMMRVGDDAPPTSLRFYKDDYVVVEGAGARANFLRDDGGRVAWLRYGGRLFSHQDAA
jgi:CubicO group peptidase (beta-lactamase class C family)